MPFPLRTLEPLKLCRLEEAGGDGPAPGEHAGAAEGSGGRRRGAVPLFGTLEQVSSYALVSLLMQLSDLSRCAGDIFGGILSEADSLCHRNARLQRRLGALEELLARLDHRKVKIREYRPSPALGAPPGRCWGWALLCDLFKNRKESGKLKHPRFSCPVLRGGGRPRSRRCPRAVAHPPWDTPAPVAPDVPGCPGPCGTGPCGCFPSAQRRERVRRAGSGNTGGRERCDLGGVCLCVYAGFALGLGSAELLTVQPPCLINSFVCAWEDPVNRKLDVFRSWFCVSRLSRAAVLCTELISNLRFQLHASPGSKMQIRPRIPK